MESIKSWACQAVLTFLWAPRTFENAASAVVGCEASPAKPCLTGSRDRLHQGADLGAGEGEGTRVVFRPCRRPLFGL